MKRIYAVVLVAGFLSLSVLFYSRTYSQISAVLAAASGEETKVKVVIDPGHGGNDPGGIGVSGCAGAYRGRGCLQDGACDQ